MSTQIVEREGDANCKHPYVNLRVDIQTEQYGCDCCGRKESFEFPRGSRRERIKLPLNAFVRPNGGFSGEFKGLSDCVYRWKTDENGRPMITVPESERKHYKDVIPQAKKDLASKLS